MVKNIFIRSFFIFLPAVLFFNGCENFQEGSEIKESIDYTIETVHSEKINLEFEQNNGKITPSDPKTVSVNEVIKLKFVPDDDYVFDSWKYQKNEGQLVSFADVVNDVLQIKNAYAAETELSVTSKSSFVYKIVPVCKKRPEMISFSPVYGVSNEIANTPVRVVFSKKMSDASIYWTIDDFKEIWPDISSQLNESQSYYSSAGISLLKAENHYSSDGKQYYYCYKDSTGYHFKNLEFPDPDYRGAV